MSTVIPDARQQHIPQMENAIKCVLFVGALLLSFYAATQAAHWQPQVWFGQLLRFGILGTLAVANAMLILAMAILAHEAVHKVLFKPVWLNDLAGGLLSAMGLIPFYANRQFHLTHHRYAHQPHLDPEHQMHGRSFWFAFIVGPHIGIFLQHKLLVMNALTRMRDPLIRRRVIKDSVSLAVVGLLYVVVLPSWGISLIYTVLPMFLVFPLVFSVRAMSDHYGIPEVRTKSRMRQDVLEDNPASWQALRDKRRIQVSGWIVQTPGWLEWLWSHVNYHEVHHKYPYLSHCHLKAVFHETRDSQPYIVAEGYWRNLLHLVRQPYYGSSNDNPVNAE